MRDAELRFTEMVSRNAWGSAETLCGPGSTIEACRNIIDKLPEWIKKHRISSILDLGCGDFHWMSQIDLSGVQYDGYDLVPYLVESAKAKYSAPNVRFHHGDLLNMAVPKADLVVCKDVLSHLPTDLALSAFRGVLGSGSRFFAASTHVGWPPEWREIKEEGGFSPVDLEQLPFSMGIPFDSVEIPAKPGNPKKLFALWKMGEPG